MRYFLQIKQVSRKCQKNQKSCEGNSIELHLSTQARFGEHSANDWSSAESG
jgi:hypothetical protein